MPSEESLSFTEADVADHKLIVYFSDDTSVTFTVEELAGLHPEHERTPQLRQLSGAWRSWVSSERMNQTDPGGSSFGNHIQL